MNITLLGVRGSIPATSPDTKKYGGNTSCIEVTEDGWQIVLDAGSGIQNIHHSNTHNAGRVDILLTHLHMDHIQGLGFFKPLFDPSSEVHIWGPASMTSLRARLGRYFSPPLFPVYFRNLTCKLVLHEIGNSTFTLGPFSIQSEYVLHPGPTVGFRIKSQGKSFTYIPDHEPALSLNGLPNDVKWLSGNSLAWETNLLFHDAQYTREEYNQRRGWGHSCIEDAIQFASLSKVKKLLLAHHDPTHSDAQLDRFGELLKQNVNCAFPVEMAREGSEIVL